MSAEVQLTRAELEMAVSAGIGRRVESLFSGRENQHGFHGADTWTMDIESAAAEMAVAKFLGTFYAGTLCTFKAPDVAEFQVRWTHLEQGCLVVRPADSDRERFVLVVGIAPSYRIVGWTWGKDAKQQKYLKSPNNRPPAYFVPQRDLKPLVPRTAH